MRVVHLLTAASLLSVGCTRHVFSPPTRVLPLETPQTLDPGKTGVQVEGSAGGGTFGPDIYGGTVRARHGVAEDVDVIGEATVIHVSNGKDESVSTHPNVYAARAGIKYRIFPGLAVGAGLGGGGHAAGGFVSPDATIITGWENRWVIPFFTMRAFTSHPLGARSVDLGAGVRDSPQLTLGFGWAAGLRVPVLRDEESSVARASFTIGLGANYLADTQESESYGGFASSFEMVF